MSITPGPDDAARAAASMQWWLEQAKVEDFQRLRDEHAVREARHRRFVEIGRLGGRKRTHRKPWLELGYRTREEWRALGKPQTRKEISDAEQSAGGEGVRLAGLRGDAAGRPEAPGPPGSPRPPDRDAEGEARLRDEGGPEDEVIPAKKVPHRQRWRR